MLRANGGGERPRESHCKGGEEGSSGTSSVATLTLLDYCAASNLHDVLFAFLFVDLFLYSILFLLVLLTRGEREDLGLGSGSCQTTRHDPVEWVMG
jgi:hypothetical protein